MGNPKSNPSKRHHEIAVGPYWTNVLSLIGREDLRTPDGSVVIVKWINMDSEFEITAKGKVYKAGGNLSASALLNNLQVGVFQED